jgi:protein-L-isoaspartate(D-aspartate) O-methyltransferase
LQFRAWQSYRFTDAQVILEMEIILEDRSAKLRRFFASYVTAKARVGDPRIEEAFRTVRREDFIGPGPWSISIPGQAGLRTPDDDPAFIYQDTLIAIDPLRGINNGEPALHARCLDALKLREGETVLQVGAGVGYYTALLAHLVGPTGKVHAYEIEADLAGRAIANLESFPWVDVHASSGVVDGLPKASVVYVNAGITQTSWAWLDALAPRGRLLFPLQPPNGFGAILLITRPERGPVWPAKFICSAGFIPCAGLQDHDAGRRLMAAFSNRRTIQVQSFRIDSPIDDTCWFVGDGWWLSTAPPPSLN